MKDLVETRVMTEMSLSKPRLPTPGAQAHVNDQWSDWIWDERLQLYYRAKRGLNSVWNYEYAEIGRYLVLEEPLVHFKPPPLEYLKENSQVIFPRPLTYTLKEKEGECVLAVGEDSRLAMLVDNVKTEVSETSQDKSENRNKEIEILERVERLELKTIEVSSQEQRNELETKKEKRPKRRRGRSRGPKQLGW